MNNSTRPGPNQTPESSEAMNNVGTQLQLRPERFSTRPTPRLSEDAYWGRRTYHVTMVTDYRAPFMDNMQVGRFCIDALERTAASCEFSLLAYCFMPDHAHLLLQGQSDASNLISFVQRFKQVTGYHFKKQTGDRLWQASFFDRVLRKDESIEMVAGYILDNPVKDGLKADHPAYSLRGGAFHERGLAWDGAEAAPLHSSSLRLEKTKSTQQRGAYQ
jgi:putative transposase